MSVLEMFSEITENLHRVKWNIFEPFFNYLGIISKFDIIIHVLLIH